MDTLGDRRVTPPAWVHAWAAALGVLGLCSMLRAGAAEFDGKVVLELLDDIEFDHKLKLVQDFSFRDEQGHVWLAPRGAVLEGWSVPRELRTLPGLPVESDYRKASVVHDFHSRARSEPWRAVHRMLYAASLSEGISGAEAKMLYLAVYAGGWRWEARGSSCYGSCHAAADLLAWRPDATRAELLPVAQWLQHSDPSLEEIEKRVDVALKRPGPHLFAQVRQ
jgi:hypothetical protein